VVQKKLLKCVYLLSTWTKHKVLFRRKFLVCEVDSISLVSFCVYNFYFIWWPIKLLLPSSSTKFGTCLSVQCLLLSLNKETAKRREIIISEKKSIFWQIWRILSCGTIIFADWTFSLESSNFFCLSLSSTQTLLCQSDGTTDLQDSRGVIRYNNVLSVTKCHKASQFFWSVLDSIARH